VNNGADVNHYEKVWYLLQHSILQSIRNLCCYILKKTGISMNISALHLTVKSCNMDILKELLLHRNLNVNIQDKVVKESVAIKIIHEIN
jgi:hypothetical protein